MGKKKESISIKKIIFFFNLKKKFNGKSQEKKSCGFSPPIVEKGGKRDIGLLFYHAKI